MFSLKKIKTAFSLSRKEFLRVVLEKSFRLLTKVPGIPGINSVKKRHVLKKMIENPRWEQASTDQFGHFIPFVSQVDMSAICRLVSKEEKERLIGYADNICEHKFNLLGSGLRSLGKEIDWQTDFVSGRTWPYVLQQDSFIIDLLDDSDIKIPWELSRHQFFTALGQAYCYTGDEKYVHQFAELINQWISTNAYKVGVNWLCSMDIGFRAISWMWGRTFFGDSELLDEDFWTQFHGVLASHAVYIYNNIEDWGGIKNNHFMSNGTALYLLGSAFPNLEHAKNWKAKGKAILEECMEKQVLDDGADYEMSTAYHRLVLELLLVPYLFGQNTGDKFSPQYAEKLEKMFEFVAAYTKPDGEIALFGDNDDGRCQILSEYSRIHINDHRYLLSTGAVLFERKEFASAASQFFDESLWLLGPDAKLEFEELYEPSFSESRAFPEAGFYLMRNEKVWAFIDCGPRGIPGAIGVHGHNDATSFELAFGNQSVVVDSGMFTYSRYPEVNYVMKSTKAHNLLIIDDEQISETPKDLWVIGEDVHAEVLLFEYDKSAARLHAIHHGYERLDDPVNVSREFIMSEDRFSVIDTATALDCHQIEVRFHTPLKPKILGSNILLENENIGVCVSHSDVLMTPYFEPCNLAYSYGVYRPQGFAFGWRRSVSEMPWTGTSVFSIEGTR